MNGIPIRQAAVALAFMLAACDTIPAEQVQFYADSYAEAYEAGNRLYDGLVDPIRESQRVSAVAAGADDPAGPDNSPEFPKAFDPAIFAVVDPSDPQRRNDPGSITVRRAAMKAVSDYNAIMVHLASGRTAAELSQRIDVLGNQLNVLPGLTGVVSELMTKGISGLTGLAEGLRADSELREALVDGREPVQDVLEALRQDTATMYAIYRPYHGDLLVDRMLEVAGTQRTIVDFVARHQAPSGDLAESFRQLQGRFSAASREIPAFNESALETNPSRLTYDRAANESLDLMVGQFEAAVAAHRAKVAEINAFYQALGVYARMLDQVKRANVDLVDAARSRTVTLDPVKVVTTAAAIRQDAATILAGL